jgi:hypothetical protein
MWLCIHSLTHDRITDRVDNLPNTEPWKKLNSDNLPFIQSMANVTGFDAKDINGFHCMCL